MLKIPPNGMATFKTILVNGAPDPQLLNREHLVLESVNIKVKLKAAEGHSEKRDTRAPTKSNPKLANPG